VIVDPVTARWTEAFFSLASKRRALDQAQADVDRMAQALGRPEVRGALLRARAGPEERRKAREALLQGLSPLGRNLVSLLFERGREAVVLDLSEAFRRRRLAERGAVEGVVESPRPLSPAELGELSSALRARLGKEVLLTNRIAPELVAGVRVVVDFKEIDCSVRGRLERLRRKLMGARIAAATA
jgi:F-type H+-transporting ATPase subunit delta